MPNDERGLFSLSSDLTVFPSQCLHGDVTIPGDKSISHRALMLSAIAQGTSTLTGFLPSDDCIATLQALRACGVEITHDPDYAEVKVKGVGLYGLQPPTVPLDCQNSGTSMRLLAGLLAGQPFSSVLIGDKSLSKRPMKRVMDPLRQMGAKITANADDQYAPLTIAPSAALHGIRYALPIPSAQVKSCVLLAGLYAPQPTRIIEREHSRDHTERMLAHMGAELVVRDNHIDLIPGKPLVARDMRIPGDISSATFFMVGASMTPGSHLWLRGVGVNPRRTGIMAILRAMGADLTVHDLRMMAGEPVADLEIIGTRLQGIDVPLAHVVSAIDEFPAIFMAAACARGQTVIRGIGELRFKESDRIALMTQALRKMGVSVTVLPEGDGVIIEGKGDLPGPFLTGGILETEGDHRIAMACAIGALRAIEPIIIKNAPSIASSFPNFPDLATMLGLRFQ